VVGQQLQLAALLWLLDCLRTARAQEEPASHTLDRSSLQAVPFVQRLYRTWRTSIWVARPIANRLHENQNFFGVDGRSKLFLSCARPR
jgi:hypothetical protein